MAEPAPESASPTLAAGLGAEITAVYSTAETDIITTIAARVRHATGTAGLLGDTYRLQVETTSILGRAERDGDTAVRRALAEAYRRGNPAGRTLARPALADVTERLRAVRTGITRWVTSLWQRLIGLSTQPDGQALMGRVLQREAGRGITLYTPGGRRQGAVSLAAEVVQHSAGGAVIDGFADRLAEDGGDLVIVTLSPHPCPVCEPWEHRILSVSGDNDRVPSLAQARAGGLFHPRCRHTLFAWHPGFVWPPHSIQHLPGSYEAEQRQRAIERHIREWKLRDAAALDDVTKLAAKRKVRAWEAALRQHLAAHNLQRSRQRERIDFGHTRPLKHAHGR